jgi:hypothetical protein
MNVRADVVELLHAGYSDRAIARQLNVDPAKTVAPARAFLGLPKAKPGRKPAATPEDLFWLRVQPVDDGHILWTGHRQPAESGACPVFRHGGKIWSAYRVAFKIRHGREPEGKVTPTCDRNGCVAPDHTQDRRIRQSEKRVDALYDAIFEPGA